MQEENTATTLENYSSKDALVRRRMRVKRMKTLIVTFASILLLLPTLFCIVLGLQVGKLQNQVDELISMKDDHVALTENNTISNTQYTYASNKTALASMDTLPQEIIDAIITKYDIAKQSQSNSDINPIKAQELQQSDTQGSNQTETIGLQQKASMELAQDNRQKPYKGLAPTLQPDNLAQLQPGQVQNIQQDYLQSLQPYIQQDSFQQLQPGQVQNIQQDNLQSIQSNNQPDNRTQLQPGQALNIQQDKLQNLQSNNQPVNLENNQQDNLAQLQPDLTKNVQQDKLQSLQPNNQQVNLQQLQQDKSLNIQQEDLPHSQMNTTQSIDITVNDINSMNSVINEKSAQGENTPQELSDNSDPKDQNIKSFNDGLYTGKKVYLTFDDGPSKYTDEILDILAEYEVNATFFVIGKTDKESKRRYQRIVEEGHTLGMHSYSHIYQQIYNSIEDFDKDFTKLWKLLYDTTGYMPTIYRFPGGSSNLVNRNGMDEFIKYLNDKSFQYYDWNVVNGDATGESYTIEQLIDNVLQGIAKRKTSIVLMHDVQSKKSTVDSLPMLLEELISQGAEILPLDESVPPIQQIKAEKIK